MCLCRSPRLAFLQAIQQHSGLHSETSLYSYIAPADYTCLNSLRLCGTVNFKLTESVHEKAVQQKSFYSAPVALLLAELLTQNREKLYRCTLLLVYLPL